MVTTGLAILCDKVKCQAFQSKQRIIIVTVTRDPHNFHSCRSVLETGMV